MGQDNPRPTRPHCIVADDEAHLRRVLVRLMESDGFTCHEAANGRIALELLDRVDPMLVLTDLHMPELDGMGLLREVRTLKPDAAVIMIIANATPPSQNAIQPARRSSCFRVARATVVAIEASTRLSPAGQ